MNNKIDEKSGYIYPKDGRISSDWYKIYNKYEMLFIKAQDPNISTIENEIGRPFYCFKLGRHYLRPKK